MEGIKVVILIYLCVNQVLSEDISDGLIAVNFNTRGDTGLDYQTTGDSFVPTANCDATGCVLDQTFDTDIFLYDRWGTEYILETTGMMNTTLQVSVHNLEYEVELEYMYTAVRGDRFSRWAASVNADGDEYDYCLESTHKDKAVNALGEKYAPSGSKYLTVGSNKKAQNMGVDKCDAVSWFDEIWLCTEHFMTYDSTKGIAIFRLGSEVNFKADVKFKLGRVEKTIQIDQTFTAPQTVDIDELGTIEVEGFETHLSPLQSTYILCMGNIDNRGNAVCEQLAISKNILDRGTVTSSGLSKYTIVKWKDTNMLYDKSVINDWSVTKCDSSSTYTRANVYNKYNRNINNRANNVIKTTREILLDLLEDVIVQNKDKTIDHTNIKQFNIESKTRNNGVCCVNRFSVSQNYLEGLMKNYYNFEQEVANYGPQQVTSMKIPSNSDSTSTTTLKFKNLIKMKTSMRFKFNGVKVMYNDKEGSVTSFTIPEATLLQNSGGSWFKYNLNYVGTGSPVKLKGENIMLPYDSLFFERSGEYNGIIAIRKVLDITAPIRVCLGDDTKCATPDTINYVETPEGNVDNGIYDNSKGSSSYNVFIEYMMSNTWTAILTVVTFILTIIVAFILLYVNIFLFKYIGVWIIFIITFGKINWADGSLLLGELRLNDVLKNCMPIKGDSLEYYWNNNVDMPSDWNITIMSCGLEDRVEMTNKDKVSVLSKFEVDIGSMALFTINMMEIDPMTDKYIMCKSPILNNSPNNGIEPKEQGYYCHKDIIDGLTKDYVYPQNDFLLTYDKANTMIHWIPDGSGIKEYVYFVETKTRNIGNSNTMVLMTVLITSYTTDAYFHTWINNNLEIKGDYQLIDGLDTERESIETTKISYIFKTILIICYKSCSIRNKETGSTNIIGNAGSTKSSVLNIENKIPDVIEMKSKSIRKNIKNMVDVYENQYGINNMKRYISLNSIGAMSYSDKANYSIETLTIPGDVDLTTDTKVSVFNTIKGSNFKLQLKNPDCKYKIMSGKMVRNNHYSIKSVSYKSDSVKEYLSEVLRIRSGLGLIREVDLLEDSIYHENKYYKSKRGGPLKVECHSNDAAYNACEGKEYLAIISTDLEPFEYYRESEDIVNQEFYFNTKTYDMLPNDHNCTGSLQWSGNSSLQCSRDCCLYSSDDWETFNIVDPMSKVNLARKQSSSVVVTKQYGKDVGTITSFSKVNTGCTKCSASCTLKCARENMATEYWGFFLSPLYLMVLCLILAIISKLLKVRRNLNYTRPARKLYSVIADVGDNIRKGNVKIYQKGENNKRYKEWLKRGEIIDEEGNVINTRKQLHDGKKTTPRQKTLEEVKSKVGDGKEELLKKLREKMKAKNKNS